MTLPYSSMCDKFERQMFYTQRTHCGKCKGKMWNRKLFLMYATRTQRHVIFRIIKSMGHEWYCWVCAFGFLLAWVTLTSPSPHPFVWNERASLALRRSLFVLSHLSLIVVCCVSSTPSISVYIASLPQRFHSPLLLSLTIMFRPMNFSCTAQIWWAPLTTSID